MSEIATLVVDKDNKSRQYDVFRGLTEIFVSVMSFLTVSSLFTGISGFFMAFTGYLLLGLEPSMMVCSAVFLMAFSTYSLNKLTDLKEDEINMPERLNFLRGRKKLVLYYSIGAYVLSVILAAIDKPSGFLIIFVPLVANVVYGSKLIPGLPRLKDIPVMKNVVVAFSWASVTALLPANHSGDSIGFVIVVFCFLFAKDFINTVLYDIRDVKGDSENGIRTIPVILGAKRTTLMLLIINSLLLAGVAFTDSYIKPIAAAIILYGYAYIIYFRQRRNPLELDFFVDGEWVFVVILYLALKSLGLMA